MDLCPNPVYGKHGARSRCSDLANPENLKVQPCFSCQGTGNGTSFIVGALPSQASSKQYAGEDKVLEFHILKQNLDDVWVYAGASFALKEAKFNEMSDSGELIVLDFGSVEVGTTF